MGAEYCSTLAEGDTSHGFCDRKEWPSPFFWLNYLGLLYIYLCFQFYLLGY